MKKMIDWLQGIFEICLEALKKCMNALGNHCVFLVRFLFFSFVIISLLFYENASKKEWITAIVLFFIVSEIFAYIYNEFEKKKKIRNMPKKRFTIKSLNGDIGIEESRLRQAIIYLSILEDEIW